MRIVRHSCGLNCSGQATEPNMIPYIPECPRKWSWASCFPSPAIRASAATKSPLRTSGSRRTSTPGCFAASSCRIVSAARANLSLPVR